MTRNEYLVYARDIAQCILEERNEYGGELQEMIDDHADSSEHVIYWGKATDLIHAATSAEIDVASHSVADMGGYPEGATYWQIQATTAFWVLRLWIDEAVAELMLEAA